MAKLKLEAEPTRPKSTRIRRLEVMKPREDLGKRYTDAGVKKTTARKTGAVAKPKAKSTAAAAKKKAATKAAPKKVAAPKKSTTKKAAPKTKASTTKAAPKKAAAPKKKPAATKKTTKKTIAKKPAPKKKTATSSRTYAKQSAALAQAAQSTSPMRSIGFARQMPSPVRQSMGLEEYVGHEPPSQANNISLGLDDRPHAYSRGFNPSGPWPTKSTTRGGKQPTTSKFKLLTRGYGVYHPPGSPAIRAPSPAKSTTTSNRSKRQPGVYYPTSTPSNSDDNDAPRPSGDDDGRFPIFLNARAYPLGGVDLIRQLYKAKIVGFARLRALEKQHNIVIREKELRNEPHHKSALHRDAWKLGGWGLERILDIDPQQARADIKAIELAMYGPRGKPRGSAAEQYESFFDDVDEEIDYFLGDEEKEQDDDDDEPDLSAENMTTRAIAVGGKNLVRLIRDQRNVGFARLLQLEKEAGKGKGKASSSPTKGRRGRRVAVSSPAKSTVAQAQERKKTTKGKGKTPSPAKKSGRKK